MITEINESKTFINDISCYCKCKSERRIYEKQIKVE